MYHNEDVTYQDIERYFSDVAHELKSPLLEIELYTKVIEEDSGELMTEQSLKDLQTIRSISTSAQEMLRHFISRSRIHNKMLDWEILSMKELVEEIAQELAAPLTQRSIHFEIGVIPNVIGDRFLFRQMVCNILSNSVKFTESRQQTNIRVYSYQDEDVTSICFEDNGIGFDSKYSAKVFELFERLHTDRDIEGSGIGLALVKSIAERFDGSVDISARENEGCTVTVKLPNNIVISAQKEEQLRSEKENFITIGVVGAYTGEYSNIAPCRRWAYQLAVDEINAAGGINGKQVRLKIRDFASDVSSVPQIAWELAAVEKVDVIMGGQLSSARECIREVVDKQKIPYFFNALYEGGLADHYTFCISATPEQNVCPMLDYLLALYGKNCYIIAADYNYGVLTTEFTKDYIEKNGGSVVGIEYFSAQKSDFDLTIEQIKRAAPDILISFCVSRNQNNFYEQWHKRGIPEVPIASTIGVGLSYLHRIAPAPVMDNTYFMSSYAEELQTAASRAFTKKLRERFSVEEVPYIEFDAETAYTSVYFYKKAVEMAGSTDTEKVIAAMESGQVCFDGPGGMVRMRGEDHQTVRDEHLFRVNARHELKRVLSYSALQSSFVEKAILQEMNVEGGLCKLGTDAPNIQYNMMFHRIVS